jgi:hypothetical protein
MSDAIEGRPPRSGQDEDYYAGYAYMEPPEPTPEFPEPQVGRYHVQMDVWKSGRTLK